MVSAELVFRNKSRAQYQSGYDPNDVLYLEHFIVMHGGILGDMSSTPTQISTLRKRETRQACREIFHLGRIDMLVKPRSASAPILVVVYLLHSCGYSSLAFQSICSRASASHNLLSHHIVAMNRLSKGGRSTSGEQLLLVASCDTMR